MKKERKVTIYRRNLIKYWGDESEEIFEDLLLLFSKMGAKVKNNAVIYRKYRSLCKTHRTIHWKGVEIDVEYYPAGISMEFNFKENRMNPHCTGFWNLNDDRSIKLNYLQGKHLDLVRQKLEKFFSEMGVQINDDFKKKTPEEQILEKESINKHIHGGPKTIEELSEYVNFKEDYYFNTYNRISAEKRKILSGQRVYFYSWAMGNRLCVGTAIHNINNMWWVISGGILHNVACFELYLDISRIPLKNPRLCKRAEDRIEQKMIKMASERDYVGALAFQKKLEILKIENEKRKIKWKEYLQQENF